MTSTFLDIWVPNRWLGYRNLDIVEVEVEVTVEIEFISYKSLERSRKEAKR